MKAKSIRSMLSVIALAALLSVGAALPAFASQPGFQMDLPAFGGHKTVVTGTKDKASSANAYIKLNASSARGIFWIDRASDSTQVTDGYTVSGGSQSTLPYKTIKWTGTAYLRGAQVYWGPGTDHVSGWVNFG